MTSNETRLTVAIADLIISEGLSFNLYQKSRFKKVLDLARNVSKCYQPPNRKLISKDILDVIHDQNMESNFSLIKKESDFFFVISRWWCHNFQNPNIEHFGFRENVPVAVLERVDCQGHLEDCGEKDGTFICNIFLEYIKKINRHKLITDVFMIP